MIENTISKIDLSESKQKFIKLSYSKWQILIQKIVNNCNLINFDFRCLPKDLFLVLFEYNTSRGITEQTNCFKSKKKKLKFS